MNAKDRQTEREAPEDKAERKAAEDNRSNQLNPNNWRFQRDHGKETEPPPKPTPKPKDR